jgi:phage gp45-like
MLSVGGNRDHGIVIATEHRDHRFKNLDEGDTVLYNKNGKYIHLKGDNIEALVSKLKIENDSHEMVAVLSEFMQEVIDGLTFTAIGPQPWIPATKAKLEAVKTKMDTFKE